MNEDRSHFLEPILRRVYQLTSYFCVLPQTIHNGFAINCSQVLKVIVVIRHQFKIQLNKRS